MAQILDHSIPVYQAIDRWQAMAIPVEVKIKNECPIESVHVSNKMMPMSYLRNKQYR